MDMTHLHALELRLSHERQRLNDASEPSEVAIRTVWVNNCKKEVEAEKKFLGIVDEVPDNLSDEELLDLLTKE